MVCSLVPNQHRRFSPPQPPRPPHPFPPTPSTHTLSHLHTPFAPPTHPLLYRFPENQRTFHFFARSPRDITSLALCPKQPLPEGAFPAVFRMFVELFEIGRASCRERVCQYG